MSVGDACTYRIFSKCSWPKLIVNATDIDLYVADYLGKPDDIPDNDHIVFRRAEESKGTLIAMPSPKNRTANCDTEIRMYVAFYKNASAPALSADSFLTEESRVLQGNNNSSLIITVIGNMGGFVKNGLAIALGAFAML